MESCTVAIVANSDKAISRFRMPLIRELVDRCSQVHIIAPSGDYVVALESAGATFVPWRLSRGGMNSFT